MDNPRRKDYCAYIHGDPTDLNRLILKKEFGAYGDIKKIYINEPVTFAKVYLHDQGALKRACTDLNNRYSWKISFLEDRIPDNSSNSITSELVTADDMDDYSNDEEFVFRDGFVDIHGRDIAVLESAENEYYVNVKDVRKTGFLIFPKEDFNACLILKDKKLKEFELYLLGQAQSYLLQTKSKMSEDEILTTIERVKHKMLGNYENCAAGSVTNSTLSESRLINHSSSTVQRQNLTFDQSQSRRQQLDRNFQPSTRNFVPNQNNANNQQGGNRRKENDRNNRDSYGGNPRNRDQPDQRNNAAGPGCLSGQKSFSEQRTPRRSAENGNTNNYRPRNKSLSRNQAGSSTDGYSTRNKTVQSVSDDQEEDWSNETPKTPKMNVQGVDKKLAEHNSNDIGRVKLELNKETSLKVVSILKQNDKEPIYYVQPVYQVFRAEILQKEIINLVDTMPEILPKAGDLCLHRYCGEWHRAKLHLSDNGYEAELLDYGNRELTKGPFKKLPESMRVVPAQAIPCKLNSNTTLLKEGDQVKVIPKEQQADGTYVINVVSEQIPKVGIPQPLPVLQNDDKVLLIDCNNGCLYVRTKNCCERLKELNQYIDQLDKKPVRQVEKDQMVLCTKDGLKGLHRAIVLEKDDETAKVKYLDYVGEERLSLKSLRDVDDRISTEPLTLIECPESKELAGASAKSLQLIEHIIEGKRKLVVKIEKGNIDLTYEGTSLFKTVRDLNKSEETQAQKPEPVNLTESPAELKNDIVKPVPVKVNSKDADARISYDEVGFVDVKVGKAEYMCYSLKGKEVTLLGTTEQDTKYLETLLCYEVKDNTPYEPEEYEMCLTMFDDTWSRAVPTFVNKEKGEYEMLFVDFGNIEIMKKEDIRKLPHELKDIPILAIQGEFSGLPDDKKVSDKLAELITDGSTFEVHIKGDRDSDTLACPIEIPSIYEELRKLGLI